MWKRLLLFFSIQKLVKNYILVALMVTFGILTVNILQTNAFPWQEILIRGVQVIQLSTISDQQEVQIGRQIREELIKSGRVKLYNHPRLNRYLNDIGSQLSQIAGRPEIPYTFSVVKNEEINAFATMGGFVYINTGLIKLADNEAELASVLAHEIAHIIGRDSLQQMRQQAIAQGILSATGLNQKQAVQLGVKIALDLPYSRQDEYEADRLGLAMLTKAGYAPGPMLDFMKKLQRHSSNAPSFLSTHPAIRDRIEILSNLISNKSAYVGKGLNNRAYNRIVQSTIYN